MKHISRKNSFCGDFSIIKSIFSTSTPCFSRLFIAFLLIFSSTLLFNFSVLSAELNTQQVPVKKTIPSIAKKTSPKIIKSKVKSKKNKKSVVIKKDTLRDIDPASVSSPLYNN